MPQVTYTEYNGETRVVRLSCQIEMTEELGGLVVRLPESLPLVFTAAPRVDGGAQ